MSTFSLLLRQAVYIIQRYFIFLCRVHWRTYAQLPIYHKCLITVNIYRCISTISTYLRRTHKSRMKEKISHSCAERLYETNILRRHEQGKHISESKQKEANVMACFHWLTINQSDCSALVKWIQSWERDDTMMKPNLHINMRSVQCSREF